MESPPPPSSTIAAVEAPQSPHLRPPSKSINSINSLDDPPFPKLRFMCSFGGHIVPRPHDKSLYYAGGDTRMIVFDPKTSLSDLHHRLSKTLLNNQPFTLKYQLPNEDLDSLISVTSDEDLENMIEEYERLNNNSVKFSSNSTNATTGIKKSGRIRLFLFPKSSSVDRLLLETASNKSDDWFINVLNGKGTNLSTATSDLFSESSSVNYLLGLDDHFNGKAGARENDVEAQLEGSKNEAKDIGNQDVHSVPDSPMVDTTSSFGSTSSSPSTANLPPIKVHMEENQKLGIEPRFQPMNHGAVGGVLLHPRQELGGFPAAGTVLVSGVPAMVGGNYANPVFSGDEGSDHGGSRKAEQAHKQMVQLHQLQQKQGTCIELPSPDSVSSEGRGSNPLSRQRQTSYQEPIFQANPGDSKMVDQNFISVAMQPQVQESVYVLSGQFDQNHPPLNQSQQFVHGGARYIPVGATPIPSYHPMYSSQQHHPHHQVYFLPARPTPAYNVPVQQPNYSESTSTPAALPSQGQTPQSRNVPASKPEIPGGIYRTAATQFLQAPSSQHQTQYVAFTQIHHPSQPASVPSAANPNYAYEFADQTRPQMYYTQPLPPQMASHHQAVTSAPAAPLPEASTQLPTENIKQQIRTSQP